MPNLIDKSFFVRDILIPNFKDPLITDKLNSFIVKYEKECLKDILGYPLYKAYVNESSNEVSSRMSDLINGKDYTYQGRLKEWQGLKHDTDISLIAYYTYYFIQESDAAQTTGVNTSVQKTSDSISVSPVTKMINAWNKFSEECDSLFYFLWINRSVYPEFTYEQLCYGKRVFRRNNEYGF